MLKCDLAEPFGARTMVGKVVKTHTCEIEVAMEIGSVLVMVRPKYGVAQQ